MYRRDGGGSEKGRGGGVLGEKVNVKGLKRWETKQPPTGSCREASSLFLPKLN